MKLSLVAEVCWLFSYPLLWSACSSLGWQWVYISYPQNKPLFAPLLCPIIECICEILLGFIWKEVYIRQAISALGWVREDVMRLQMLIWIVKKKEEKNNNKKILPIERLFKIFRKAYSVILKSWDDFKIGLLVLLKKCFFGSQ